MAKAAEYVLAYDLGTGGNKASPYEPSGHCVAQTSVPYQTFYPRLGWHEQRPMDWWNAWAYSDRLVWASGVRPVLLPEIVPGHGGPGRTDGRGRRGPPTAAVRQGRRRQGGHRT